MDFFSKNKALTLTIIVAGLALNSISSPVNGFLPLRFLTAGFLEADLLSVGLICLSL